MHNNIQANHLAALVTQLADTTGASFEGLSPSAAGALLTLRHRGAMTTTALARIIGLSQPAAVRVLDGLARRGMIRRGPKRAREVEVSVTGVGDVRARKLQERRLAVAAAALSVLAPEERAQFDMLASRLLGAAIQGLAHARNVCRFCDHGICDGADCPAGEAARLIEEREEDADRA